ncbi:MAG: hypothetical protein WCO00_07975 [Rhodospirillaceae bacterium]
MSLWKIAILPIIGAAFPSGSIVLGGAALAAIPLLGQPTPVMAEVMYGTGTFAVLYGIGLDIWRRLQDARRQQEWEAQKKEWEQQGAEVIDTIQEHALVAAKHIETGVTTISDQVATAADTVISVTADFANDVSRLADSAGKEIAKAGSDVTVNLATGFGLWGNTEPDNHESSIPSTTKKTNRVRKKRVIKQSSL